MWTCGQCGERHPDQFKECWKCFGKEAEYTIAEKPLPPIAPAPERKLRSTASIVFRAAVGFLVGMLLGTAIYQRYGFPLPEAIIVGAIVGVVVGFFVGVFFWVAFPYHPDESMRAEADEAEFSGHVNRSEKPEDF